MEDTKTLGDAAPPPELPPGTRLLQYEIGGVLGAGSSGMVYWALDRAFNRKVAIREYAPPSLVSRSSHGNEIAVNAPSLQAAFEAGRRSFVNEARQLAHFDHPALLKVLGFWEGNGTAYMAVPFLEGRTLRGILSEAATPPDEGWLRAMLSPLTQALVMMHAESCFHRRIGPDSIMRLPSGRWLLLDFDSAQRAIESMTQAETVVPKPGYVPVEQYVAAPDMKEGAWTDVYSLAAVVYRAIVGRSPPLSLERLIRDTYQPLARSQAGRYSASFLAAIDRALAVRPEQRTRTIERLRDEMGLDSAPMVNPKMPARPAPLSPGATTPGQVQQNMEAYRRTADAKRLEIEPEFDRGRDRSWLEERLASIRESLLSLIDPRPASPLLFGLSAPSRAVQGAEFIVSFAAYIEAARAQAARHAQTLVGPDARQLLDVAPARGGVWNVGTPFVVRLSGRSLSIEPQEQTFEWSGTKNVLAFAAQLLPSAEVTAVLTATVLVEGLVVACIQMQVAVGATKLASSEQAIEETRPAPSSAFASYASRDIEEVSGRLSSLTRHAPGLKIFQDCLDLKPGEDYKAQLQGEIASRDVFWLFWSRNAAASRWVRWELETAVAQKAMETIIPMPLEDPALAPPPKELEHEHFRDRYLVAGQGLKRVQEEASLGALRDGSPLEPRAPE